MKKPENFDNVEAIRGTQSLPAGVYKVQIVDVLDTYSEKSNNPMLVLSLDIVGGQYDSIFIRMHESRQKADANSKYPCVYRQVYDGSEFAIGRFKGLLEMVKESNPKFTFDWNKPEPETAFLGCVLGAVFQEEEFVYRRGPKAGTIGTSVLIKDLIPVSEIETTPTPEKKLLDRQSVDTMNEDIPFYMS